uniref:Uncharacterized protein n=1 Tax=Cucumis melo TaxID=3656 RepID=A0A9I9EIT2_CUCME
MGDALKNLTLELLRIELTSPKNDGIALTLKLRNQLPKQGGVVIKLKGHENMYLQHIGRLLVDGLPHCSTSSELKKCCLNWQAYVQGVTV